MSTRPSDQTPTSWKNTARSRDDWSNDPHHLNPDVHYRLYSSLRDDCPVVICVQDFDYFDYDARQILSPAAWDNEDDALLALHEYNEETRQRMYKRTTVKLRVCVMVRPRSNRTDCR